jgi:hypothetical protein
MSRVDKATKLKSYIQPIPNYDVSCFQVPVVICNKMKSSISNNRWMGYGEPGTYAAGWLGGPAHPKFLKNLL